MRLTQTILSAVIACLFFTGTSFADQPDYDGVKINVAGNNCMGGILPFVALNLLPDRQVTLRVGIETGTNEHGSNMQITDMASIYGIGEGDIKHTPSELSTVLKPADPRKKENVLSTAYRKGFIFIGSMDKTAFNYDDTHNYYSNNIYHPTTRYIKFSVPKGGEGYRKIDYNFDAKLELKYTTEHIKIINWGKIAMAVFKSALSGVSSVCGLSTALPIDLDNWKLSDRVRVGNEACRTLGATANAVEAVTNGEFVSRSDSYMLVLRPLIQDPDGKYVNNPAYNEKGQKLAGPDAWLNQSDAYVEFTPYDEKGKKWIMS